MARNPRDLPFFLLVFVFLHFLELVSLTLHMHTHIHPYYPIVTHNSLILRHNYPVTYIYVYIFVYIIIYYYYDSVVNFGSIENQEEQARLPHTQASHTQASSANGEQ